MGHMDRKDAAVMAAVEHGRALIKAIKDGNNGRAMSEMFLLDIALDEIEGLYNWPKWFTDRDDQP